jgi:hypothetical protein
MTLEHYIKLRTIPNRPETYFKYVTAPVAKIILANKRLRWSSPRLFNDPFDVQREFDLGFDIEELKEPLTNELLALIAAEHIPSFSGNSLAALLVNFLRRGDHVDIRNRVLSELPHLIDKGIEDVKKSSYEELKKQWSEFIPEFRILCLSSVHDNPLMWSHYSDSHRGVVLELQCIDNIDSAWLVAQPVIYQSLPPMWASIDEWAKILTGQQALDLISVFTKYACTKTPEWEDEKEWRVISFARKGESDYFSDYGFNPHELRSVYLGCDISKENMADIISLLSFDLSHVKAFRGKKIERARKVAFERVNP